MDPVQAKLLELEKKVDAIYASVEKTRKYFLWTGLITLAVILLPLLALPFAISQLMSVYGSMGDISSLGL